MSKGYMTPEEFKEKNKFDFNALHSYRDPWPLADPTKAIDCEPYSGPWVEYFNKNLYCGQIDKKRWLPRKECRARDWSILNNGIWMPKGSHTIKCNGCGRVEEVLVVANDA